MFSASNWTDIWHLWHLLEIVLYTIKYESVGPAGHNEQLGDW